MPLPPPTFSKSKWLAFFAELTSKITHHNVSVIIEGVELLRRLITSRVSIAAFLQEGNLLQHLLDTAIGAVRCERAPTPLDAEMLHALFQCLKLFVDMMASLYADGDAYYCLLVMSRSTVIIEGLACVIRGKNRQHFGVACNIIEVLLSLPFGIPREPLTVEGLPATRHVRSLEEAVTRCSFFLQQLFDASSTIAVSCAGTPVGLCSQKIANQVNSIIAPSDVPPIATIDTIPPHQLELLVHAAYTKIEQAQSHDDCFDALNELWCCYVVDPQTTALRSDKEKTAALLRFLHTAPNCSADDVIFRATLSWFAEVFSKQPIPMETRDALLGLVPNSLIPMLSSAPPRDAGMLEKPSTVHTILMFLQVLELSCTSTHIASWVAVGLLGHLEKCIDDAESVSSVLVDAPSTVDGTLPDEIYLNCALKSCRSEIPGLAITSMKLVASLLERHGNVLRHDFGAEVLALVQSVVPRTLKIVINNPTMQASRNASVSLLHHVPRCHRACRPTTIGECAAVSLVGCLALEPNLSAETIIFVLSCLPALQRAVKDSVVPHLRAVVSCVAVRVCTTCEYIVAAIREMPSLIPTAAVTILNFTAESPPWEAAGAAELLHHFLTLTAEDRSLDESIQIGQSVLPLQLLKIVSSNPILYSTAAMAQLIPSMAEHQARLKLLGLHFQCVLAPMGTKSIPLWISLLHKICNSNTTLSSVLAKLLPMKTITKDALERATSAFEEISVQFVFCAAVFKGLRGLFALYPEFREAFDPELMNDALTSTVSIPSPSQLAVAIGQKFCIDVAHSAVLQRAYEELIVWSSEFTTSWFHPAITMKLPALQSAFFDGCSRIMSSEGVSHIARSSIAAALNSIVLLRHQVDLASSLDMVSCDIFRAMQHVHDVPIVQACRARLVAAFAGANQAAFSTGWIMKCIQELHEVSCTLRVAKRLDANETEAFSILLSLVTSVMASDNARALDGNDASLLASSLLVFSCFPSTRSQFLRALRVLASSEQGRHLLLVDAGADHQGKTCFSRLIQLTFPTRGTRNEKEVIQGLEAVSVAVAKGRDTFAAPLIKLKVIDSVENQLAALDRQRAVGPVGLYRFLASATLSGEMQCLVARHSTLLTLLVEAAANQTEIGTLSLLCIRNCCFHQGCKWQLCQDSRVLQLLRSAMLLVPSACSTAASVMLAMRQQVLATSALWVLAYNNQRGKSCIRGLLRQPLPNTSKPLSLKELAVNLSSSTMKDDEEASRETSQSFSLETALARNLEGLVQCGL